MTDVSQQVRDPVCGMTVQLATALAYEHNGRRWYFCAQNCLERFKAGPEKFIPDEPTAAQQTSRRPIGREILWAIGLFLLALTVVLFVRGFTGSSAGRQGLDRLNGVPAGRDQAVDGGQGGVIATATYDRQGSATAATVFTLSLDTHTLDLTSFNPAAQVRLRADSTDIPPQTAVTFGERSVHHQSYRLSFPAPGSGSAVLVVRGLAGVAERQLPFQL